MQEQEKFESWCLVEIMGHLKVAGKATTMNFGSTVMLKVDIPETKSQPEFSRMFGMSSIFSITPCDEKTARIHAESYRTSPTINYSFDRVVEKEVSIRIESSNQNQPKLGSYVEHDSFE